MPNGIFKLDWTSVLDALATAVAFAVLTAIYSVVTTSGFDVFATDWGMVGHNIVNVAVTAAVISLGRDFLSTDKGSVLGVTPATPQQ